jgi:hypothetical protein
VDLFANAASSVYYDDMSLIEETPTAVVLTDLAANVEHMPVPEGLLMATLPAVTAAALGAAFALRRRRKA